MKTQIPRFLLGSPKGWKTFTATADCVVLPGFSDYEAAADFCQADTPDIWELQPLGCDQGRQRLDVAYPQALKLVAINPGQAAELSLFAIALDSVCGALRSGAAMIEPDFRLMRDHWDSPWNHAKIAASEPRGARPEKWYISCLHPQDMKLAGGQPLWFWLDWFEGKHVLTELQTERDGSLEREFFLFPSRGAAEGFYGATVARLLGCISRCEVESHCGSEFEVTMWEKQHAVCNRKSAVLGKRSWS